MQDPPVGAEEWLDDEAIYWKRKGREETARYNAEWRARKAAAGEPVDVPTSGEGTVNIAITGSAPVLKVGKP
jgi:hypothetical protein